MSSNTKEETNIVRTQDTSGEELKDHEKISNEFIKTFIDTDIKLTLKRFQFQVL